MLAGVPGQAVSAPLAQEADQGRITLRSVIEKLKPEGTIQRVSRRNCGELADEFRHHCWPQSLCMQIDRPARSAQEGGRRIPDRGGDGKGAVGLSVSLDCGRRRRLAHYRNAGGIGFGVSRPLPADLACPSEREPRLLAPPYCAIPSAASMAGHGP